MNVKANELQEKLGIKEQCLRMLKKISFNFYYVKT